MEKEFLTWEEIDNICRSMAGRIKKEFKPECIVAIARGGLVPARIIADEMEISRIYTIQIKSYEQNKMAKKPELIVPLIIDIRGKKILLIDDVSDRGDSLELAVKHIKERNPAELRVATLHMKPHSVFLPDYYAEKTDKWIIYPWGINEED
ncbi:phosphoribosyltransferase [Candidatus Micrarchaeota archaeon]|nr:phosphoribosyltransferase [Candidatus Micrarchaeota archaeon]